MTSDLRGRALRDLRVSVTDRCNFRCRYCMPREVFGPDFAFLERTELLSFEELTRVVRAAVGLGVRKVRLTGGEPLMRRDLPDLVAMLADIDGIDDLALTTNGSLLRRDAGALRDAGLGRVTVSLDSLDDATFRAVQRRDPAARPRPRRHRRRRRGGLRAGEDQHGRQARGQRPRGGRPGRLGPRQRPHGPLHRVHGRRRHQRLADGRGRAGGRDRRRRRRPVGPRAGRARGRRRGRDAVALRRRRRRDRRHRERHAAVLRRLHAGPAVRRRRALHLPVRHTRHRPPGAPAIAGPTTMRSPARWRRSGAPATTATPSSAPATRRRPRTASRCPTSAADRQP